MSLKILIVDDEKNVLRMVGYLLEREGYEISAAVTGIGALQKIEAELPDLVVLDVMLPDMSGFEICERLRKQPKTVKLPIIMFSALADNENKNKGYEFGADAYLSKAIEPEEFLARVNSLLKRTQMLNLPKKTVGKVLGFMGAKGGVGTTTTVLNLASALVAQNKKVVAAELRIGFGTFSAQLNLDSAEGIASLYNLSPDKIDEHQIDMRLIELHSGLRVLVGPQKIDEFQEFELQQTDAIIETLALMGDYAILDLSSHLSEINQTALKQCDSIALVVEPEVTSIASAKITLELLKSWGITKRIIKLVIVNRSPSANSIRISDIESQLNCEILGVIPPAIDAIIAAQKKGIPVVLTHGDSDVATAFHAMANKINAGEF